MAFGQNGQRPGEGRQAYIDRMTTVPKPVRPPAPTPAPAQPAPPRAPIVGPGTAEWLRKKQLAKPQPATPPPVLQRLRGANPNNPGGGGSGTYSPTAPRRGPVNRMREQMSKAVPGAAIGATEVPAMPKKTPRMSNY